MPSRSRFQRTHLGQYLLGPLETEIMTAVWRGASTTAEIGDRLSQGFAYTTIITTLQRLVAKKLLHQKMLPERRLLYSATCTEQEWQERAAKAAVELLFSIPNVPRELMISAFHQAIGLGSSAGAETD